MGATNGYARPVQPVNGRMSTWHAHTTRYVPSVEPGTDYYTPIGTPVRSASSGRVVDTGDSIYPATGRYVTVDLDDGRRVRYLHLRNRIVSVGDRVQWGQVIAYSGASGYGEEDWSWNVAETGGAHVHMTLWARQEYKFGRYATLDPELYMSPNQPGGTNPPNAVLKELLNMDKAQIIHFFSGKNRTWALIGATVPGGVRTTTSQETVNAWALIYGPSKDTKTQAAYNTAIAEARVLAASWLDQQKRINGAAN